MTWVLVRLLSRQAPRYLLLVGAWTMLRAMVLVAGLLLQHVFDTLAVGAPGAGRTVTALIVALLATELVRLAIWYGVVLSRMEPGYTYGVRAGLQANVLHSTLDRPAGVALTRPIGDVVSRLGEDSDEVGNYAIWSASNISRLLVAVAALSIMFVIDPVVAAALAGPIVLVTVAGRALNQAIGRMRAAHRRAGGEVSTIVGEAMSGVLALKVARAEDRMVGRLRAAGEVRRRFAVRETALLAAQASLFRATTALSTGAMLLVAAGRLRTGTFTLGDLALFVFYIQFVAEAVNALGMFLGRTKRAELSLSRVSELAGGGEQVARVVRSYLDRPPPDLPPPSAAEPPGTLTALDLTYRYPGSGRGIEGVCLELPPGSFTVITGRVGAGKSTLVQVLLGLLPAERGEIRWNGRPVRTPGEFLVPPRVAYVPQVPRLFTGSLRENLLLGEDRPDAELLAALHRAAFDQDLAGFADGLDTVVGPRGLRLSGGQVQRMAAGRAVLRGSVLVVDDVSNALDIETERSLLERLRSGRQSVLAVSHRPEVLAHADHIVVLDEGRVSATGTPAELFGTGAIGSLMAAQTADEATR